MGNGGYTFQGESTTRTYTEDSLQKLPNGTQLKSDKNKNICNQYCGTTIGYKIRGDLEKNRASRGGPLTLTPNSGENLLTKCLPPCATKQITAII